MRKISILAAPCLLAVVFAAAAHADLAVSGNDGKQVRAGDGLPMTPTPDTISIISFSSTAKPAVIGEIGLCGTLQGPPVAIAVSPDAAFALATCPQKMGTDGKNSADNKVNVIGLDDATHPKLLQTVEAGQGATAVALNRAGTMALVTGVGDDTVTLFAIKNRQLTQTAQVKLDAKAEPRQVLFAPDGKTAYALRFGDGKMTRLAIAGGKLSRVTDYAVGTQADGGTLSADGRTLIVNVFGGVPGKTSKGATAMVDTRSGAVTDVQDVGPMPEHAVFSPDGKYLAVVVGNGSATVKTGRNFDTVFSKLVIFKPANGKLEHVADAKLGHACQGAVWSADGKRLLVQCSVERDIRTFDFDGTAITEQPDLRLVFVSRPGAIAVAASRQR
jgi:DNA-binding beta-propeller fold protein YncE